MSVLLQFMISLSTHLSIYDDPCDLHYDLYATANCTLIKHFLVHYNAPRYMSTHCQVLEDSCYNYTLSSRISPHYYCSNWGRVLPLGTTMLPGSQRTITNVHLTSVHGDLNCCWGGKIASLYVTGEHSLMEQLRTTAVKPQVIQINHQLGIANEM